LAEEFKPEIIIANGGSDSHFADMLGGLGLTVKEFYDVASLVSETADRVCGDKLVIVPGSGYNPKVLPACWYALIAGAVGLDKPEVEENYTVPEEPTECRRTVEKIIDELKRLLRKHWTCFGGFSLNAVP